MSTLRKYTYGVVASRAMYRMVSFQKQDVDTSACKTYWLWIITTMILHVVTIS